MKRDELQRCDCCFQIPWVTPPKRGEDPRRDWLVDHEDHVCGHLCIDCYRLLNTMCEECADNLLVGVIYTEKDEYTVNDAYINLVNRLTTILGEEATHRVDNKRGAVVFNAARNLLIFDKDNNYLNSFTPEEILPLYKAMQLYFEMRD